MSYEEPIHISLTNKMANKIRELAKKHGYSDIEHLGRFIYQMWYETHREKQEK